MIQPNSISPSINSDDNRRSALVKVYRLLLMLAEETEKPPSVSDNQATEEKNDQTGQENFKKEI